MPRATSPGRPSPSMAAGRPNDHTGEILISHRACQMAQGAAHLSTDLRSVHPQEVWRSGRGLPFCGKPRDSPTLDMQRRTVEPGWTECCAASRHGSPIGCAALVR
ncbi:hypothetical protein XFF6166_610066 [Xanthomonas citri pv. fuscans]|nr:hypothetical protein XFF6166_610066 [Xanthomonas citri pv. fuscans]SOO43271.1 hypothetical protein XFF1815_330107 [Xanthomonas citri pv. fuscans]